MARSLAVVNYRSAALAEVAIRTARAASREPLQVIVVDNSVDPREADALQAHADVLIVSPANVGYAAAINAARRACDGDLLIVTNPDVVFAADAIDALCDADAHIAGPALYWDDALTWLLPPSDLHTTGDRLGHALATRSARVQRARDRRRTRERAAFWRLEQTTFVPAISGAVMAIRTSAFDRVGGFDERFRLYFEETDFLRRVGSGIAYVPRARARHLYNQSAGGSNDAAAMYAASELAYLRKWSGPVATRLIKSLERPPRAIDVATSVDAETMLFEASPLPDFETAAGHFAARGEALALPADVLASWRGGPLYLRAVALE